MMLTARSLRRAFAASTIAVLAAAAPAHAAGKATAAATDGRDAAAYCSSTGGVPSKMFPFSGMNNDPKLWMRYGGEVAACTYTNADTSSITLWQSTLASPAPTMAALAYYAQVPQTGGGPGNPAPAYCNQLGGAWMVGNGLDGGGWSTKRGGTAISMCVFADGSAIDDWGLLYHAYSITRGIDLATVLKFANPY